MTQKQKEYIEFIKEFSSVKFTGNPDSQKDISAYINANAEIAKMNSMDSWQLNYI